MLPSAKDKVCSVYGCSLQSHFYCGCQDPHKLWKSFSTVAFSLSCPFSKPHGWNAVLQGQPLNKQCCIFHTGFLTSSRYCVLADVEGDMQTCWASACDSLPPPKLWSRLRVCLPSQLTSSSASVSQHRRGPRNTPRLLCSLTQAATQLGEIIRFPGHQQWASRCVNGSHPCRALTLIKVQHVG